jgi:hypothetical protein
MTTILIFASEKKLKDLQTDSQNFCEIAELYILITRLTSYHILYEEIIAELFLDSVQTVCSSDFLCLT